MNPTGDASGTFLQWRGPLLELVEGIRERTRSHLAEAIAARDPAVARPVGHGVGDLTFGLDLPSERWIASWFEERARSAPLSVLTEDSGWRHRGPDPDAPGGTRELPGFDHGGPRIAFDPVDGTRNLMADLRSAWTVVSFAPPGGGMPRLADLTAGIVSELPPTRAASARTFVASDESARAGYCEELEAPCPAAFAAAPSGAPTARRLRVDHDARVDHGYFPVFRYEPALRPALAALEAELFARLAEHEGADLRTVYDDQYISNAGQLVLLMGGTYRMIVDARALVAERAGRTTVTSKPYDVGGAILCARAAGARIHGADGEPLDFPIDATTPVHMAGFVNEPTERRILPHWRAALAT